MAVKTIGFEHQKTQYKYHGIQCRQQRDMYWMFSGIPRWIQDKPINTQVFWQEYMKLIIPCRSSFGYHIPAVILLGIHYLDSLSWGGASRPIPDATPLLP